MSLTLNRHIYLPLFVAFLNCFLFLIAIISLFIRDADHQPHWSRCVLAILIPSLMAYRGLKRKTIDYTGAIAGMIIGMSVILSSYVGMVAFITCYLATSKATRIGEDIKRQFEPNFKKGGQRNWIQIVSNLGAANIALLLRLIWFGVGEIRLDFLHNENYWNSWLLLSSLISISAALGDTFSSELGPVFSGPNTEPLLITTLRRVPRGTNGGVTIDGFIAACIGGFIIGLTSYISIIMFIPTSGYWIQTTTSHHIKWSTPQWPLLHFCLYSGLLGSTLDSLMGATLQYTGFDHNRRRIIENDQQQTVDPFGSTLSNSLNFEHITGRNILNNHEVNLIMTIIMATIVPLLIMPLWPFGFGDSY
ncbi:transmembrane protein 19 [Dermatophagoides pteronyssinus]|uniref:transmembrane protein 19 n=1 Tax=Dermatophagoides pteronyssinus TaxID=6956 RepID=UPI003F66F2A7